mgnify:CR=1 FL=1
MKRYEYHIQSWPGYLIHTDVQNALTLYGLDGYRVVHVEWWTRPNGGTHDSQMVRVYLEKELEIE